MRKASYMIRIASGTLFVFAFVLLFGIAGDLDINRITAAEGVRRLVIGLIMVIISSLGLSIADKLKQIDKERRRMSNKVFRNIKIAPQERPFHKAQSK